MLVDGRPNLLQKRRNKRKIKTKVKTRKVLWSYSVANARTGDDSYSCLAIFDICTESEDTAWASEELFA